jgi:anthranilate 1,2-dioxygenase ferredoxin subunit
MVVEDAPPSRYKFAMDGDGDRGLMSGIFHDVIGENSFPEDGKFVVMLNGWQVLLCKTAGGYFAVNNRCTHAASPLSGGRIRRDMILCPFHGARFDLPSGRSLGGAYKPLRCFAVRVVDGRIAVAIPEMPPGVDEVPVAHH